MMKWCSSCRAKSWTQDEKWRGSEDVLLQIAHIKTAPPSAYLPKCLPVLLHQLLHHAVSVHIWFVPHRLVQKILHVLFGFFQNEIHYGHSRKLDCWVGKLSNKLICLFCFGVGIWQYNMKLIKWLTLRPCVKKTLLQTGGTDITIIMDSKRGKGIISPLWKTVEISGWAS